MSFYIIAVIAVLSISSFNNKGEKIVDSSKNKVESTVVEAEKPKVKIRTSSISDEEAKKLASKAVKDYLNNDSDDFTETHINRQDYSKNTKIEVEGEKYTVSKESATLIQNKLNENNIKAANEELELALRERPNVINVIFSNPHLDKKKFVAASVDIDADTKEILSVFSHSNIEEYKGEPDRDKIKDSIIDLFNRIDVEVDEDSLSDDYDIDHNFGRAMMDLKLTSGQKASIVMDLRDYEVISYTVDYLSNKE